MASGLPDAKITVILDTAKAEKDAEKLGKGGEKEGSKKTVGGVGRTIGTQPDARTRVGIVGRLKQARGRINRVRRTVYGPLMYAQMAADIAKLGFFLSMVMDGILKEFAKGLGIPGLEKLIDEKMKGSAWLKAKLSDFETMLTAAGPAFESAKAAAKLQYFATGNTIDKTEVWEIFKRDYQMQLLEADMRHKIEEISTKAVTEQFSALLVQSAIGGSNK